MLVREFACSLNFLTEEAHTAVSMLGKIFKIIFLPLSSSNFRSDRSALVNLNEGAFDPIPGSSPEV